MQKMKNISKNRCIYNDNALYLIHKVKGGGKLRDDERKKRRQERITIATLIIQAITAIAQLITALRK